MASKQHVLICLLLMTVLSEVRTIDAVCSPIYGQQHQQQCDYLPAPPGHAPSCARPGYTYCEHPKHYPRELIQHLLEKWRHDHKTLVLDEAEYDFNAYFLPPSVNRPVYGPANSIQPQQPYQPDKFYPEPIYIPKPSYTAVTPDGKTYIPPPPPFLYNGPSQNFTDYYSQQQQPQQQSPFVANHPAYYHHHHNQHKNAYDYNNKYANQRYQQNGYGTLAPQHHQQQPNDWIKAYPQQTYYNHLRSKRSLRLLRVRRRRHAMDEARFGNNATDSATSRSRAKRQSNQQQLCETRSRYVTPRAAANKEGQWFYLVNVPGYTQQVNTETCASQQCSGLCSLPATYTSRCEQKYVQKRLVALDGSGSTLMNDLFWFPTCCVCTISN